MAWLKPWFILVTKPSNHGLKVNKCYQTMSKKWFANSCLDKLGFGMTSEPPPSAFGCSLTMEKQVYSKQKTNHADSSHWQFAKAPLPPARPHPCFHPHCCLQVKENDHLEIQSVICYSTYVSSIMLQKSPPKNLLWDVVIREGTWARINSLG